MEASEARTMAETDEEAVLLRIRTLLALERNYFAEERTALAEFRTGLALALIAPLPTTVVAYIFHVLPTEEPLFFEALSFTIFVVVAAMGIWMGLRSRSKLKKIWGKKKLLREHQVAIIKSIKATNDLLGKLIVLEEHVENRF